MQMLIKGNLLLYTASLIRTEYVIPAKAGIQRNTGFRVKPGMTNGIRFMSSCINDQSGAALVVALIMMILLTLIGLASTFTSTLELKLSGNKRGSTDAFYAAEGGGQVVLANIAN